VHPWLAAQLDPFDERTRGDLGEHPERDQSVKARANGDHAEKPKQPGHVLVDVRTGCFGKT